VSDLTDKETGNAPPAAGPENTRILLLMAVFGLAGGVITGFLISAGFGVGLVFGTAIAFLNYFWLRKSLKKAFDFGNSEGRPSFAGSGYFTRYLVIGGLVALVYISGLLPIAAVLLGASGFAFALVTEGLLRLAGAVFVKGQKSI